MAIERNSEINNKKAQETYLRPGSLEYAARLFSEFLADPAQANSKANELIKGGKLIERQMRESAGRFPAADNRMPLHERIFYEYFGAGTRRLSAQSESLPARPRFTELLVESVTHDVMSGRERSDEEKQERLDQVLNQLRENALASRSSPNARRAHEEIESYNHELDDWRKLYEAPEDRTRAEHADDLNQTDKEVRYLYERGAGVYGDVLVIPTEAHASAQTRDEVRIGTTQHAVESFSRIIPDRSELARTAQEFVELADQIAGRTADPNARLAVFQTYYKEITHETEVEETKLPDGSTIRVESQGRRRTPEEQRVQLAVTLERMRATAAAMRKLEWKTERAEFVEIGEWERSLAAREQAAENDTIGFLTNDATREHEQSEEQEHEGVGGGFHLNDQYESIRLDGLPPRLPEEMSVEESRWLRGEMIPQVDRQLEAGARPAEIIRSLNARKQVDERRAQDELVSRIFEHRSPERVQERSAVTRGEELRALFTLRALTVDAKETEERKNSPDSVGQAMRYERAVAKIEREIDQQRPTDEERAATLDEIAARASAELESERLRLAEYEAAEREIAGLSDERRRHHADVRLSPEWLAAKSAAERVARAAQLDAKGQLVRGTNALPDAEAGSRYPDLTGDEPKASRYVEAQLEGRREVGRAIARLTELLETPELDGTERQIEMRRAAFERHYRVSTGFEIGRSADARLAVEAQLGALERIAARAIGERTEMADAVSPNVSAKVRGDAGKRETNVVFVAAFDKTRARLPLGSFNEYQTLIRTIAAFNQKEAPAERIELPIHIYRSLYGREITGHKAERAVSYDYLREYVNFRLHDEGTRMRNESRLYQEFSDRLDSARSFDELRRTANAIRQENYDREKHPESYRAEREEAKRRGEQAREPLSETGMKKLFLSLARGHYTEEMRRFRMNRAGTGRERAMAVKGLAAGRAAPSPSLGRLLIEFDKARSWSGIRAFTAQLLNHPERLPENLPRFSRVNLYVEHARLAPAERDHLFRTIQERRDELKAGLPVRVQERTAQTLKDRSREEQIVATTARADAVSQSQVPRESASFQAYTAAATWREAELVSQAIGERGGSIRIHEEKARASDTENPSRIVGGVSDRKLDTAATLLNEFKPALVGVTAVELKGSGEREMRQVGEILSTFQHLRRETLPDGRVQLSIVTPEQSEIPRESWERVLDYLPRRLSEGAHSSRAILPEVQRQALRRQALAEAWDEIAPRELRHLEAIIDAPVGILSQALAVNEELKRAQAHQARTRVADRALSDMIKTVAVKAHEALVRENMFEAGDRALITELTRGALRDTLRGGAENKGRQPNSDRQRLAAPDMDEKHRSQSRGEEMERARGVIRGVIAHGDARRYQELAEYLLTTKNEYLETFRSVDERVQELNLARRELSQTPIGADREHGASVPPWRNESPSFQLYSKTRRDLESIKVAAEVRRMLNDPDQPMAAQLAELSRDETKKVRDLVPEERQAVIRASASRDAWWQLLPPELHNREEQREQALSPRLKDATLRVSEAVGTTQLIERGLRSAEAEDRIGAGAAGTNALMRSFVDIDEAQRALAKARDHEAAERRQALFAGVRPEMEHAIGTYLKKVLHEHGEGAFEPGAGGEHHTQMTIGIMKETLARHQIEPASLNLNDSRIETIAGNIVRGLPRELAANRERNRHLLQLARREHEQETLREEQALGRGASPAGREPTEIEKTYGHQQGESGNISLDEEFVEQQVSHRLDRTPEMLPHAPGEQGSYQHGNSGAQHFDPAVEVAKSREYERQYALTR